MVVFCVFWGLKLTGITMAGEGFCGMDEHVHSEACMERELICELSEDTSHMHTAQCMQKTLHCTLPEQEGHIHNETCSGPFLTCLQEETAGHTHGEACFEQTLTCTVPEEPGHAHGDLCYTERMECGLEESEDHIHGEGCMVLDLTCEVPESSGHVHGTDCWYVDLICTIEEQPGHSHEESCYTGYSCGMEESEGHFHSDGCYVLDAGTYICGQEECEPHVHTDACYIILQDCSLEEHIHTPNCYSDVSADVEDEAAWEASLSGLIRSPDVAENVIMVARSQLGVTESLRNFQVDAAGIRRGISRYGQWYGNPYGDWSAMFVSFCLDYAGVHEIPKNAGPESMRLEWETAMLYQQAGQTEPVAGNLLFLDKDEDGAADAVAIITGWKDTVVSVIEGDLNDPVTQIGGITLEDVAEEERLRALLENTESEFEISDNEDLSETEPSESPEETMAVEEIATEEITAAETENPSDMVAETLYSLENPALLGYGLLPLGPDFGDLAYGDRCYVWLDGTNGGLKSLGGAADTRWTTTEGAVITLPSQWESPDKYSYALRGWYDVTNNRYYKAGDQVTVTGNMVFYADWVASTYDIGQFNSQVADTVSTNEFVTVHMFDYNFLFNVLSSRASVNMGYNSHTETWRLLTSGNNPYNGQPTLNYIFRDWDQGSEDISYPSGVNNPSAQYPTDAGSVYPGLYNNRLGDLLFNPNTDVIGKQYLGTGDYLFQFCTDPNDEHYGYYYYNSEHNAASYNQSAQRFYVYEYLECSRQSASESGAGKYSDFLPLNSPYVNTNGTSVTTYQYDGIDREYVGTNHYMYDHEYNTGDSTPTHTGINFLFGMSMEVDFYLPDSPGTGGNKDVFGKDMHFQFTGDDDVWIFVDDQLVLDLGGIHGMEGGDINFSTGEVSVNGSRNDALSNTLRGIGSGEHKLKIYYLERGSSMSNCAIYFNLAPRFKFSIQKEDVLTRDVLNGAQFSVYTDEACTIPAELWTSEASHDRGEPSTNAFSVVNGTANMWGMGAGKTYYIKETRQPDAEGYGIPKGIIELKFDKLGFITYKVHVVEEEGSLTPGFTVHGIRLDEESQSAYIVATNMPAVPEQEPVSVSVIKRWNDNKSHSQDSITVYLTAKGPDGTVRRIRELTLSEQINWTYTWENLPKLDAQGNEIVYGIEEAMVPGYVSNVEMLDAPPSGGSGSGGTTAVSSFENGQTYLLGTRFGYLATDSAGLSLVNTQDAAANSDAAQWVATVNADGTVTLRNKAGRTFYYDNYTFKASSSPGTYRNLHFENNRLYCHIDHGSWQETQYPKDDDSVPTNLTYNHVLYTTNDSNQALVITPEKLGGSAAPPATAPEGSDYYQITNTPAGDEVTSFTVYKAWEADYPSLYETLTVTMDLLANGKQSGLSCQLNLKNQWTYTFTGLPVYDSDGNPISYTIEELPISKEWRVQYGEILSSGGSRPTYSTTVTNRYYIGDPMLPSTGTASRLMYILCGSSIMAVSLVYGILLRRKRERRMK